MDTKQYTPDFTIITADGTFYIEVKGQKDNGVLYDHAITDRQKAKAMMDEISDRSDETYIVITNGAELEHYDYEFSFVDGFTPSDPSSNQQNVLADCESFVSILTS